VIVDEQDFIFANIDANRDKMYIRLMMSRFFLAFLAESHRRLISALGNH
jgi:hypothetical protein